jgi:PAS domain S-box-containing protein
MKDKEKTYEQLIKEVIQLRRRIAELEASGRKRNRFEETLRTERDKAQQYLDVAEVILIALNNKGEIILINRKGNQILGYEEGELLGKNWFTTCLPSHLRKKMKSGFLKLIAGERGITEFYETPALTKSGTERIIAWHNTLLKDAQGNNIGTLSSGEDITEHRRMEEALQESEEKYRLSFMNVSDVVYTLDSNLMVSSISPSVERTLGYKVEEVINRPFYELNILSSEFLEKAYSDVVRVFSGELIPASIYEFIAKDGTRKIGEVSGSPLYRNGKIIGLISVARDITDRKKAEEALRKSEEKYRSILKKIEEGYYEVDLAGNFTFFNDAMCRIWGYPKEELMGMNNRQYTDKENAKRVFQAFNKVYRTGKPGKGYDYEIIKKDGTRSCVEASISLQKDSSGKAIGFRGIIRDITARKRAEETLRQSEDKFKYVFDHSVIGKSITMPSGEVSVNKALCDMVGYRQEELNKKKWQDITHPDDIMLTQKAFDEIISGKKDFVRLAERYVHKNGSIVWVDLSTSLRRDQAGNPLYFMSSVVDITERKKAEQALQENEERFRLLAESSLTGIYFFQEGHFLYVNKALASIFGYKVEELVGHLGPLDLTHADDRAEVMENVRRRLFGEMKTIHYNFRGLRKDGTVIFAEVHGARIEYGGKVGVIGTLLDITDRKKLQETLDKEREELKLIIDSSPIIVFYKDKEGRFIRVNKVLAEALKITEKDFVGKTVFDLYPLQIAQAMTADDQEVLQSGRPKLSIIEQYESASGVRWVQTDKIPICDNDGITIGLMGFAQDITDRKRADELIKIRLRLLEFAATHSLAELLEKTLDEVCEITKSSVGFYHFVEADQKTLSLQAWSTRTVEEFCKAADAGMHYNIDQAGVWVDCIRERRPVIHNDYASLPHRKGIPNGHVAIARELVVPIMRNNRFVAIIGIGNKPRDYTDQDVQVVAYLADVAWEIAARKQAGEALAESEKKYRQVVENATDIIYTTDINGNFTYANSIALKVTGYSLAELQRFNYLDLVVPQYRDQLEEIYANQFRMGQATTYVEFPFSNKFGEVMWFGQNASLMIEGKKIIGFQVIARDISERKQAEKALRESEEKYRDLVENITDIIYATDKHGIITYISPVIEAVSGYSISEIIGHSFFDFIYEEDIPHMKEKFQQDISGQTEPHEYRMVTKTGDVRWVRTSSRPFFESDRIVGLRGVLTDITDRKQAEEEIKRSYEQLRETLHSTVKALASTVEMKDQYTAGHQPRVTQLACAIAREMGLSEDQIEGIRMAASIHDIGKIMVPAEILNKPGPLTEIQYEMIKMHPRAGYDILKGLKLPWPVAQIILQHHERQDGSGYPQGLSGEEIMVEAKILAVANVVEAMNAHRPYRPAYDIQVALAEISKNRGTFYDAAVVDACLRLFTEKGFILDSLPR